MEQPCLTRGHDGEDGFWGLQIFIVKKRKLFLSCNRNQPTANSWSRRSRWSRWVQSATEVAWKVSFVLQTDQSEHAVKAVKMVKMGLRVKHLFSFCFTNIFLEFFRLDGTKRQRKMKKKICTLEKSSHDHTDHLDRAVFWLGSLLCKEFSKENFVAEQVE